MADLALGTKVTFYMADALIRQYHVSYSSEGRKQHRKEWGKAGDWAKREIKTEGIVTGRRTLANGRVVYNYEEPTEFHPDTYLTAYLVAFDLRRRPVLLLPEDLEAP